MTIPLGASPFDHYQLQVSEKADFSTLRYPSDTVDTRNLKTTSFQVPESLPENVRYYWRVLAYNQKGDYRSSAVYYFRTAILKPTLIAPLNAPTTPLNNLRPTFSWTSSPGASSYSLVISTFSDFSTPLVNKTVLTTSYVPTVNLTAGVRLYWRVRANGANGPSLWTGTWSFRAK